MRYFVEIDELIGAVLKSVEHVGDEIIFVAEDGRSWAMYHDQGCCERVTVEDIVGDLNDLIGAPILMAEIVTNSTENPVDAPVKEYDQGSFTWSFYKLATVKGYVTIRWYGTSNGCYSETVDFKQLTYRKEVVVEEEILKSKIACLYHADMDGFGSAFALWLALNETCELMFEKVQYGEDTPINQLREFKPTEIYILDFSYKAPVLDALADEFGLVTVIDHHRTVEEDLKSASKIAYAFDTERSGCVLTWQHLNPEKDLDEIPEILLYVQDRDLWKFELENSKEINAYIATLPEDFDVWRDFYTPEAYDCGKAILAFQRRQIESRLRDAREFYFGEAVITGKVRFKTKNPAGLKDGWFSVPMVNCSENISEVGGALCEAYPEAPFSVTYCDRPNGKRSYSLRSRNGFDVSKVAKVFQGGGHKAAAGFTLDSPEII